MKNFIAKDRKVVDLLLEAVENSGLIPESKIIRGGTDGARLCELGILCPNVFTGGSNFHSRIEWVAVPAMLKSCEVMINLVKLWSNEKK